MKISNEGGVGRYREFKCKYRELFYLWFRKFFFLYMYLYNDFLLKFFDKLKIYIF